MTTFNFTTGNPSNLTGGSDASMADIQGPFTDLRTYLNSGNLDETNVPNLSAAFTTWKPLPWTFKAQLAPASPPARWAMFHGTPTGQSVTYLTAAVYSSVFHLDPTLFNANARTTKLKLRLLVVPNAVSAALTFQAGLYGVSGLAGVSGQPPTVSASTAILSGSDVTVTNPPTLSLAAANTATSADFTCPVGYYVCNVTTSGASTPAGSIIDVIAQLYYRQV